MMFSERKEYTSIEIDAIHPVDFKKIDHRIEQKNQWSELYPSGTTIIVPSKNMEEIIEKLKQDKSITSVNRELTAKGIEINSELKRTV